MLTVSHLLIEGGQGKGLKVNGSPGKLCELFTLLCSLRLSEGSSWKEIYSFPGAFALYLNCFFFSSSSFFLICFASVDPIKENYADKRCLCVHRACVSEWTLE